MNTLRFFAAALLCLALLAGSAEVRAQSEIDPLPSWNQNITKAKIVSFVKRVTDKNDSSYVPPEERIASFDLDGTLWPEKPVYAQVDFMAHCIRAQAKEHIRWQVTQPFKAVIEQNYTYLGALSRSELAALFIQSHSRIALSDYEKEARTWLFSARHPGLTVCYDTLMYQPMTEFIALLKKNGFRVYICSGSSLEFVRAFSQKLFDIPPEQVIGTTMKYRFQGRSTDIVRYPELASFNDGDTKALNLHVNVGRRPVIAVGNSDGDIRMCEYAQARKGPSMIMVIRHDDGIREFSYKKGAALILREAAEKNWLIISMKKDFFRIFAGDAN